MAQHLHAQADQQSLFAPHRLALSGPEPAEEAGHCAVQEGQRQHHQREQHIVGEHGDEQDRAQCHVNQKHEKLFGQVLRNSVDG